MERYSFRTMVKSDNEIVAIFEKYEGTSELLQRVADFLRKHAGIGKDRTKRSFRHIKNVLKQVLEKIIAFDANDAEESRQTLIIDNILEITTLISDVDEGKAAVTMFVHPCLNLLADEQTALAVRLEAVKFLNSVIDSFMRENGELGELAFVENFDDLLTNAGDVELQLCLTELICRMLPAYDQRYSHSLDWFQNNLECRNDFLAIKDAEFESDCREFINKLNERQRANRSVYSVLCKEVYLGSCKVDCPVEEDSGLFWTDFNLGSKSISFFAIDTESNNSWETVTIKKAVISQTKILEKKESREVLLIIQLNQPAHTLLSFCNQSDEKYVKFIYDEKNSPVTATNVLFPTDFATIPPPSPEDVIASTPKASVTTQAVHLSSRAKGLSKTVSLSTPRRRRQSEKEESSNDSLKPKDPGNSKDKQIEKSVPNKQDTSSRDIRGDTSKTENFTVPDEKKDTRAGKRSTKPDEAPTEPFESDGGASKNTHGKAGKVKVSSSTVPAVRVISGDDGPRVKTRSSQSNDSDNGGTSVTRNRTGKDKYTPKLKETQASADENDYDFVSRPPNNPESRKRKGRNDADPGLKSEQRAQSLKPDVDQTVEDQGRSSNETRKKKSELQNGDTKDKHSTENRVGNKVEGRRTQRKSGDRRSEIESGMDITSEMPENGMGITGGMKKSRDNRSNVGMSVDESGLGKSIDSGLGKSLDKQDLTTEVDIRDNYLEDMSIDEPTVIDETQTRSQGGEDTTRNDDVFLREQDEDPMEGVIIQPSVGDGGPKGRTKTDDEADRSSGPIQKPTEKTSKKKKEDDSEEEDGEIRTAFQRKTTKTVKKKLTKTRQPRTRAAARRNASMGHGVSTSESEFAYTERSSRTRAKSAGPSISVSKASTYSSGDSQDRRNKLGTGYNTEDWQLGVSEPERRTEKKKALKNVAEGSGRTGASQSRLSLINTVFRDSFKSGTRKVKLKLRGPFEFKSNSPVPRTPQGKKILRPLKVAYRKKKEAELREKNSNVTKLNESTRVTIGNEDDSKPSFSDVAREVEEKNRVREKIRHSESTRDSELLVRKLKEVFDFEEEESGKRNRKNSEKVDYMAGKEQNEEFGKVGEETIPNEDKPDEFLDTSVVEVGDTQLDFDDQQSPVDKTTKAEQKSFANRLLNEYLDDNEDSFDRHTATGQRDQLNKDTKRNLDKDEMTSDEKRVMGKLVDNEDENSRKALKGTKPKINSNVASAGGKSTRDTSTSTEREKQNNADKESKVPDHERGDEGDDEVDLITQPNQNLRSKKQAEITTAQKTRSSTVGNARPPAKKQQEPVRRPSLKVKEEKGDEFEKNSQVRRGPKLRKNPTTGNAVKENDDEEDNLSSDTFHVFDEFRRNFEQIIEDSDDCVGLSMSSAKKLSSSRKQSETISKNKNYSKPSRDGRRSQEHWENERGNDYNERKRSSNKRGESPDRDKHPDHLEDPYKFDVNTPKTYLSRSTDSGFLGKTSTSSKKRTYDKRDDETPGFPKSDVRNTQTPDGKVPRKSRRFGRLDVHSTGSRTPHQGYHSGDDKHTPKLEEAEESPDESDYNFFSRPPNHPQESRKRKGRNDADSGLKSGSSKVDTARQQRKKVAAKDDEYEYESNADQTATDLGGLNKDTSFVTPMDNQSIPIQPRKLFQTPKSSAAKRRRTVAKESLDDEDNPESMEDDEFDDVVSISDEVQKTISSLGNEMRKTIKQKQDYVSQMATATMKLIAGKTNEMWTKQSSKRNVLVKEFTKRVNKFIEDHHEITNNRHQIEENMLSQMRKSLETLASHRKEQEKCLRGIVKTQKAFTETFNSLEDSAQSQQVDFQNSLRKELLRYRDQAAMEVQKQEIGNIKRRIQALLTSTSL